MRRSFGPDSSTKTTRLSTKGEDLSRPAEAPAIPGEIIPEWWATSSRNGGRNYLGMGGRHHSGIMGGLLRNPHTSPATPPPEQHPQIASGHLWALSGPPCGARVSRALVRSRRA